MGARPFSGLVGAVWCCFSRLCEPTAGRSWPHARLKNVKKINACKNAGESGGARGRGVEKVVVVAARTRKKIPRHTGYAKQQPGSLFNFILSWGTCTHAWLARKRSRWRGGPEAACETANGSQKVPAWPPRGEPVIRKLRVPGRVRVAAKRKLLFIQRSYRCAMGARPVWG